MVYHIIEYEDGSRGMVNYIDIEGKLIPMNNPAVFPSSKKVVGIYKAPVGIGPGYETAVDIEVKDEKATIEINLEKKALLDLEKTLPPQVIEKDTAKEIIRDMTREAYEALKEKYYLKYTKIDKSRLTP